MDRIFIDVREKFEYKRGHVQGALNLPPAKLLKGAYELEEIPYDTELVVYCRTGHRSNMAISILSRLGYKNLVNGINKEQVEARYF